MTTPETATPETATDATPETAEAAEAAQTEVEAPTETEAQSAEADGAKAPASEATPEDILPDMDETPVEFGPDPEALVVELEAKVAELNDKWMRAVAETENIRNREAREKAEAGNRAIARFLQDLLPVADNLGRAVTSVSADDRENNEGVKNLIVGIEMTEKALYDTLEKAGLKRLNPLGERFDPKIHEALFEIPDPSQPHGTVGQVLEVGFQLGTRLVRPAKVGVTKGGPKPEAAAQHKAPEAEPAPEAKGAAQEAYGQSDPASGTKVDQET